MIKCEKCQGVFENHKNFFNHQCSFEDCPIKLRQEIKDLRAVIQIMKRSFPCLCQGTSNDPEARTCRNCLTLMSIHEL